MKERPKPRKPRKRKGPNGLPEPLGARTRPERPKGVSRPTEAPTSASAGPLVARDGAVLVDPVRCPTLYRALMAEREGTATHRARWREVVDARRAGQIDRADALAVELLGVPGRAVPPAERVVPNRLPDNVRELLTKLKGASGKEARDIRGALRKLGHRGGLRSLS